MWCSGFAFRHIRTSSHPELSHFTDTICFLCLNQFVFHFKSCPLRWAFWPCKSISCTASNKYFPETWMNYVNNFIFINSAMHWNDPNTFVIYDLLLTDPCSFSFTKSQISNWIVIFLINVSIILLALTVSLTSLYFLESSQRLFLTATWSHSSLECISGKYLLKRRKK